MRTLIDLAGARWDVVLGRESWGTLVLLFVPGGGGAIRQATLAATSYDIAVAELDGMSDARLQQLLDQSQPKPD